MLYNEDEVFPFDELLQKGDEESLKECMHYLKSEEVRLSMQKNRLDLDEQFFEKKMEILKNGFEQLEIDRKKLEREKITFEAEKNASRPFSSYEAYESIAGNLFAGVNSYLALKKRYRDLLKIFHPDNMCGDHEMVTLITKEYERLKSTFDYGFKSG